MKRIILSLMALLMAAPLAARQRSVVATYPYIADIARRVGGERIAVVTLARGDFDPHSIVATPSLIARVRGADLLIINSAQLEIGWLPAVLRQAANASVQPGGRGFLDLSRHATLIDVPTSVSRDRGDVHPHGNPHYALDPRVIPDLAAAIAEAFARLDPDGASHYARNTSVFTAEWNRRLTAWQARMKPLAGARVVAYHSLFDYFLRAFAMVPAATIEPLPGIQPASRHLAALEALMRREGVRLVLQDVYHSDRAARHLAARTGARVAVLPHDVGAVAEARDLVTLFETMVTRLTHE